MPQTVTIGWLIDHLPLSLWSIFVGLLASAFTAGYSLGQQQGSASSPASVAKQAERETLTRGHNERLAALQQRMAATRSQIDQFCETSVVCRTQEQHRITAIEEDIAQETAAYERSLEALEE